MNAIRANTRVLFENILCELQNPAGVKVTDDEVFDYAVSSGARFIKLRYKGEASSYVKGFQMGLLTINRGRSGITLSWSGKTTYDGRPDRTGRLFFKPDKLGILWGFVPAFPANLKLLAACEASNTAEWEIVEQKDREEIADIVDKYVQSGVWERKSAVAEKPKPFRDVPVEPSVVEKPKPVIDLEPAAPPIVTNAEIVGPVKRGPGRPSKLNIQRGEEVKGEHVAMGNVHKG